MEQVHGVDVSWMTPGFPKDKPNKSSLPPQATATQPRQIPTPSHPPNSPHQRRDSKSGPQANGQPDTSPNGEGASPSSMTKRLSRSSSFDKQTGPSGTSPGRRSSWFSNISAKFSSSSSPSATSGPHSPTETVHSYHHQHHLSLPHRNTIQEEELPESSQSLEPPVPKISPSKNAVLQPGAKPEGSGPYTPAPPKSGQAGFLGVLRRLSSSSASVSGANNGRLAHGLVERKVLNKDHNRERCPIMELNTAKMRRVAFCVDVEIAPMPKYLGGEIAAKPIAKTAKKKLTTDGESEALKDANAASTTEFMANKTNGHINGIVQGIENTSSALVDERSSDQSENGKVEDTVAETEKDSSKKREKKKRSEEERKVRKEKRKKLAQDNGTIPLEIHYDDDLSSDSTDAVTPKTASIPATNPVRIYRRCCQLRETPILKRITEQLLDTSNFSLGIVNKLDLTGYWLQLADLVTLGDYLAVVPVREVLLENIGLTDEGLRVILAGILAAKRPDLSRKKPKNERELQGGVIERLVLKNNKLGPDGWKHLSLFIYLCRSIKHLDLSHIPFPRQAVLHASATLSDRQHLPRSIAEVFAKSLADRPGRSTLELINMGETEPSMEQLGVILDGMMKCRVKRVGLAHNYLDQQGVGYVARYISSGICEGLDLGGNDLGGHVEKIASALEENGRVWALSLAGCALTPSDLSKILPVLAKMQDFRFIDLSHNKDLFQSKPSAVGLLRRYLPKLQSLKRIHLVDVSMNSEQAIALVEVLPETQQLAHISLLENEELAKLAHAKSEEEQEEACALYASLMAAARVSKSIIAIDIDVPDDEAGEIVKAMAKQVVAYCLRNMEQMPDTGFGASMAASLSEMNGKDKKLESKSAAYPDVIMHLVGNDVMQESDEEDNSSAPDEDYVIGGTGVVKALKCCLENRGDESGRPSGEFGRDIDTDGSLRRDKLPTGGKAKDMSKHLLAGARKIRLRLQPALTKARANPGDEMNLRKLIFLDETLQGIIRRFEDEYPDTREPSQTSEGDGKQQVNRRWQQKGEGTTVTEDVAAMVSDGEEEGEGEIGDGLRVSRSNSALSRELAEEEGRVHRAGHRFRAGMVSQTQMELVQSIDDIGADPRHVRLLTDLAEDVGGEFLEEVRTKGLIEAYKNSRESLLKTMRASDPDFDRFIEAQNKALANRTVLNEQDRTPSKKVRKGNENAIVP